MKTGLLAGVAAGLPAAISGVPENLLRNKWEYGLE